MKNDHLDSLPEVFASHAAISTRVTRAARRGRLRRIHGRVYTTNTTDPLERVVLEHRWQVLSLLFPGAVVSHRSALLPDGAVSGGTIFLSGRYDRLVSIPGLRVRMMAAPGALPGDQALFRGLYRASPTRALLECLSIRRVRGSESPSPGRGRIEETLAALSAAEGGAGVLLAKARSLAESMSLKPALERLTALLTPGPHAKESAPPPLRPRRWDPSRISLFEELRQALIGWIPPSRPDLARGEREWIRMAFLDAWGSCASEGRSFSVGQAERVVLEQRIPQGRTDDARVLLGTFGVLASTVDMTFSGRDRSAEGFVSQLRRHHRVVLGEAGVARAGKLRTEGSPVGPGVDASRLVPTLTRGFEIYRTVGEPLARATFLQALISDLRPFEVGSGLVARIAMNAELVSAGERRMIFTPALAEAHAGRWAAFSRTGDAGPLLALMEEVHRRSFALNLRRLVPAAAELEQQDPLLP